MTTYRTHNEVLASTVPLAGQRVVDVGCGSGELVRFVRAQGAASIIGVECGDTMRALAHAADPEHVGDYVDGVAQALPLPDASADVVIFSYSLHHVPQDEMVAGLAQAHRVLADDGVLYVVEPVAAGAGHEVIRVIDDETEVRAHAQEALGQATAVGFAPDGAFSYLSQMRISDADSLATRVVGVDPRRAARMAEMGDVFRERFAALATRDGDAYTFEQENTVRVFRKLTSATPR